MAQTITIIKDRDELSNGMALLHEEGVDVESIIDRYQTEYEKNETSINEWLDAHKIKYFNLNDYLEY